MTLTVELPYRKPKFRRPELLLHREIPYSLIGVNPRSLMEQDRWDVVRREVYAQNNYCCFACGTHKLDAEYKNWLEAHETYEYDEDTCIATLKEIVALCHSCHSFIHVRNLVTEQIFHRTNVRKKKLAYIGERGIQLLLSAGFEVPAEKIVYLYPYLSTDLQKEFDIESASKKLLSNNDPCFNKWKLRWEGRLYPKEGKHE